MTAPRFVYGIEPSPRLNPHGDLWGAWNVVRYSVIERGDGRLFDVRVCVVTRFASDGRDKAEHYVSSRGFQWKETHP